LISGGFWRVSILFIVSIVGLLFLLRRLLRRWFTRLGFLGRLFGFLKIARRRRQIGRGLVRVSLSLLSRSLLCLRRLALCWLSFGRDGRVWRLRRVFLARSATKSLKIAPTHHLVVDYLFAFRFPDGMILVKIVWQT
jgi:hypothetical protein